MWSEYVLNPKVITSIFKDGEPSLRQIKIQEITTVFTEDLMCKINFDLKEFPVEAPAKWIQNKYNKVQLSILLIGASIKYFSIVNGKLIGDMSIIFNKSNFEIRFTDNSGGLIFDATSKWINIDKISGYIDNYVM